MKFIKQKYLTIILSIVGGVILGLALTFALNARAVVNSNISYLTDRLSIMYGAVFNANYTDTDPDRLVIITNTGNVGIGTINPTQRLTVAGTIESTTGGIKFPDGTMQSNASYAFGGIYVIEGASSCRRVNPFTGGCSCPSGFLGSFASDGPIYSIFCYKAGSISASAPVVTLSASPTTIGTGQATTLSWTSDAASCTAGGKWNGSKATNGSEAVTSSNDSDASTIHTYNLDCSNAVGTTSKNVSVNIKGWQNTTGEGNLNETCNTWLSRTGQSGVNGATASAINTNGSRSTGGLGMCWYRVGALSVDNFLNLNVGDYTIQVGNGGGGFLDGGYSATAVSRNLNCSTCYTQTKK